MAVQGVTRYLERPGRLPRLVAFLALDGAGQAAGGRWTREDVGNAGEYRLGGQIGPLLVDDRKEQHVGPVRPQLTRYLKRRRSAREIEQSRHLALLQLVYRITD